MYDFNRDSNYLFQEYASNETTRILIECDMRMIDGRNAASNKQTFFIAINFPESRLTHEYIFPNCPSPVTRIKLN